MSDQGLEEWTQARSIIGRFDDNLHDLRKYGFSFVTALLTADAILSRPLSSASSFVPAYEKLSVLLVTIGLLATMRLLDQNYRLFQRAASQRAKILEKRLNLDLTGSISEYYKLGAWWVNVQRLYDAFLGLTFLLGFAILFPSILEIVALGVITFGASYEMEKLSEMELNPAMDWSVDKKVVTKGEPVRITWTNLLKTKLKVTSKERLATMLETWMIPSRIRNRLIPPVKNILSPEEPFENQLEWKVLSGSGEEKGSGSITNKLGYFESYDWLWDTKNISAGIYTLDMQCTRKQGLKSIKYPVQQVIQILDSPIPELLLHPPIPELHLVESTKKA